MSLRDAMRKAAGLLIELPPDASAQAASDEWTEPKAPSTPVRVEPPDIDKLLADAGIQRSSPATPPAAKSAPATPSTPPGATPSQNKTPQPKTTHTKTVEQIVRDSSGPNLDQIQAAPESAVLSTDGKVNFPAIYSAAKLPDAPFAAEKMREMLKNLPPDVPLDSKRQMVKVTLGALGQSLGATPENIVADASRKLAALAAFVEHFDKQSTQAVSKMEKEIADLQSQIEFKKSAIETAKARRAQVNQSCDAESDRLDDVLEFFSLDVAPSKYAPKK